MRASDEDRQRVIDSLQQHTAAGRLSLDEFSDRVGTVYAAKTLDDLRAATTDLPVHRVAESHEDNARQLAIAFAVAIITIALLAVVYLLLT